MSNETLSLPSSQGTPWILLVEDDPLFARLFQRFWERCCPDVPCRSVGSLEGLAEILKESPAPSFVVCDRRLPDGTSDDFLFPDGLDKLIWSADGKGSFQAKPVGRVELEAAVKQISQRFEG